MPYGGSAVAPSTRSWLGVAREMQAGHGAAPHQHHPAGREVLRARGHPQVSP